MKIPSLGISRQASWCQTVTLMTEFFIRRDFYILPAGPPFKSSQSLDFSSMSHLLTKPTKWHVLPAKTQISLGICRHLPSLIRVFAVHMKKAWVLSYPLSAQWRLWLDWADSQADLSLCWVHSHFVGFVMGWFTLFVSEMWWSDAAGGEEVFPGSTDNIIRDATEYIG